MQRFLARDAKFAYSPEHASIGTVEPGERFEVESVEGFFGYFSSPADFTPERYAEAEAHKWAVTGPISVAGATAGDAVAVTIHDIEVATPGVVVYGGDNAEEPPGGGGGGGGGGGDPAGDGAAPLPPRAAPPPPPPAR